MKRSQLYARREIAVKEIAEYLATVSEVLSVPVDADAFKPVASRDRELKDLMLLESFRDVLKVLATSDQSMTPVEFHRAQLRDTLLEINGVGPKNVEIILDALEGN